MKSPFIVFKGGKIATPLGVRRADVLVDSKSGRILRISSHILSKGARAINCHSLILLPGAIDPHVHMRDPEDTSKESFSTGTASALSGGVTTIIDMPCYRNPATTTIPAYNKKRAIARKKCRCDYQLRFGASERNQKEAARSNSPSLKVFLADTGSELSCSYAAAARHFAAFPKEKPICVHAEDSARINARKLRFVEHEKVRDKISAQIACEKALKFAARAGRRRIHMCHLTTAKEVDMCRRHQNATYEINPAHLHLCIDDLRDLGFLGKVNPPLRDRTEMKRLWRKVGDDTIMASDHAPHLPRQKKSGAPGFPGVGTLLPLMLQAVHSRKLTLPRLARITSYNAARAFSLSGKGEIAEGKDADIVLVDMARKWRISAKNRLSKCGWTPFEGAEIYGKIEGVYLRGRLAYDGKKVLSRAGNGKEVK
ncbi:MAG: dihydroorotase family protein [Candidatus Micrarchaeota archaeon]|nr:dihydroorotase family protein [Candidatus Micrarchaeota archaeon]